MGRAENRLFARSNFDAFDKLAVFEDSSYELTHGLEAIVGLRWFHSYRSDEQVIVQQFFPGQPTGAEPFQRFSQNSLFKKFELSYKVSADALLYVQAAQGFRSGGPNYPGGFTTTAPPYRGDSLWDYELGWKAAFADRRVIWTGTLFRINWSHLQQLVPTSVFSYIVNAGSAPFGRLGDPAAGGRVLGPRARGGRKPGQCRTSSVRNRSPAIPPLNFTRATAWPEPRAGHPMPP